MCVQNRLVPKREAYTFVVKHHLNLKLVPSVKHANISVLFANSASAHYQTFQKTHKPKSSSDQALNVFCVVFI